MKEIPVIVNEEKCIGCGMCVKDCVASAIEIVGEKAHTINNSGCIECGHCFAVCPTGAISLKDYNSTDSGEIYDFDEFDSDKLLQAMKSRRTIRQFKDMPIEKEKVDKILEAGRYCPTAANSQNVAYTILGSKQDEIEKECVKIFKAGVKAGSIFESSLRNKIIDDKFFFKGAPLVIIVSGTGSVNASLASSYMEIMAESMGLGVLYSGFFVICSKISPKIRSLLKLPKGHRVINCMVIGYPNVKYKRIVPRKELKVKSL